jgi:hypothetical protein
MRLLTSLIRRPAKTDVQRGYTYKRDLPGGSITEKVRVLDLKPDGAGIPHVKFEVTFERRMERLQTAMRVLALQSFVESYPHRVA